jgi:2-C-methyl-D-erythritol 4-phosphate cytidylyltransferase
MTCWAIIVAGGQGKRMGSPVPKQLLTMNGITILERSLAPFVACSEINGIVVVTEQGSIEQTKKIITNSCAHSSIPVKFAPGGNERQDSVWNGLQALPNEAEIVVIHDGVRPFITTNLIIKCINATRDYHAVTVACPITETVKEVKDSVVVRTLDRTFLWRIQTPQVFRKDLIIEAHQRARADGFIGTDDCILVEHLGHPVYIIEGNGMNIKITTPADLTIAAALLPLFEQGKI